MASLPNVESTLATEEYLARPVKRDAKRRAASPVQPAQPEVVDATTSGRQAGVMYTKRVFLSGYDLATAAVVLAMSSLVALVVYPPPTWGTCENTCRNAHDGVCDDGGVENWPFDGARVGDGGSSCSLGSDCGDCGARSFAVPKWFFILSCLVTTALLIVGVEQTARIFRDEVGKMFRDASNFRRIRVPLTDFPFGVAMINRLANSVQVREKSLKVCQYIFRAIAYSGYLGVAASKSFKQLSKTTSTARRFFKFARWVKHFEDLEEARAQKTGYMRFLLHFRVAANFGADWAEDVCSLERIGVLPAGTLSVEFMLFAEYCQLALALVEILVTGVRARKEAEATALTHERAAGGDVSDAALLKADRKVALVRLELIKYVSDVGKALFDCELPYASERVFIGCSLFSGTLSTHKNMVKLLK